MISRPQQILLKRAQAQAQIPDAEYRALLAHVTGMPDLHSSNDPRLTDCHLDRLLAFFEFLYWDMVRFKPEVQTHCNPTAIFRQPGYWAAKNTRQETSRDRFTSSQLTQDIQAAESALISSGYSSAYCAAIRRRITNPRHYLAALRRTLSSKNH